MDWMIQMKTADFMLKFLRGDLQKTSAYPYLPQKKAFTGTWENPKTLIRKKPEEMGVSSALLHDFVQALQEDPKCGVHTLMVLRKGHVIAEAAFSPWRLDTPQYIYSMSKSITGMAIGMAIEEGILSLSDRLVDIFPERVLPFHHAKLDSLTIEHLLTMTAGIRFNEVGSALEKDWRRAYMESDFDFAPGEKFYYNSLNTYMLSAAFHRKAGKGLMEYLTPKLFEPLGITDITWERCPMGIEKGGWGLYLHTEDMAKLGQLYLNKGIWKGQRIISEEFIAKAILPHIRTEDDVCRHGYGYQLWLCKMKAAYQFNGVFGQYVIVHPELEMVIVMTGASRNLFGEGPGMSTVERFFGDRSRFSDQSIFGQRRDYLRLKKRLEKCNILPLEAPPEQSWWQETIEKYFAKKVCVNRESKQEFERKISGKAYRLESAVGSVLPVILQAVHGNYAEGYDRLKLVFYDDRAVIDFSNGRSQQIITAGLCQAAIANDVQINGETYRVMAEARYEECEEGILLHLWLFFIETPHTREIFMRFNNEDIEIKCSEIPLAGDAIQMLYEMISGNYAALEYLLSANVLGRPVQNFLSERVMKVLEPSGKGKMASF